MPLWSYVLPPVVALLLLGTRLRGAGAKDRLDRQAPCGALLTIAAAVARAAQRPHDGEQIAFAVAGQEFAGRTGGGEREPLDLLRPLLQATFTASEAAIIAL